jgi:tetratricopeptide (TPR) repeat protein
VTLVVLLQSPVFPPVAMLLLVLGFFVLRPRRPGKPVEASKGRPDDDAVKKLIPRAIEAKKRKEMGRAGWLYEQGQLWVKAAECHEIAGDGLWAAELYARGGAKRQAGELYRRFGHPLAAAEALQQAGLLGDAGVLYAVVGDRARAAVLFAKAGRPTDAAELYLQMGAYHQAGKLFQGAGNLERAADAYEKMLETLGRKQLEASPDIAQILESEGRIGATIRFLEATGEVLAALRTSIRHKRGEESLRLYSLYRDIMAGPLLRGAEEGKLSAAVLVDLFEEAGDQVPAARMAQLLGQTARAAELYEKGGQPVKAAEEWEAADDLREAALAWERGEHHERAARLFERTGDTLRAIHGYRQVGLFGEAGRLYETLGEADNALQAYGEVPGNDPGWRDARLQLARLNAAASRWEAGIQLYEEALGAKAPTADEVEDMMALARLLEAGERFGEAAACWTAVIRLDSTHADADDAFRRMRDAASRAGQSVADDYPFKEPEPTAPPPQGESAWGGDPGQAAWSGSQGLAPAGSTPHGLAAASTTPQGLEGASSTPQGLDDRPEDREMEAWNDPIAPQGTDLVSFENLTTDDDTAILKRDLGNKPRRGTPITTGQVFLVSASLPPGVEGDTGGWPVWEPGEMEEAATTRFSVDPDAAPVQPATPEPIQAIAPDPEPVADPTAPIVPDTEDPFGLAANLEDFGLTGTVTSLEDSGDLTGDSLDLLVDDLITPEPMPAVAPPRSQGIGGLEDFPVFADFDAAEREVIAALLSERDAGAGEELMRGNDEQDGLLLVRDGQVEIRRSGGDPHVVGAPGLGASSTLLEGELPPLSAQGLTAVRCWVLTRGRARGLATRDQPLADKLSRGLRRLALPS